MEILPTVRCPDDLRGLAPDELRQLAGEIRCFLVAHVSRTGGHLGPNLGAVELTLAVHRAFRSPVDRVLWDTGHQSYVHKIVTGRAKGFTSLRQRGGLSGYPSRAESEHDVIENSHASTALSYADGLVKAYQLRGETHRRVVAVVGDGALTGGMAWEALNNLGSARDRSVVVVLNDNGRSYAPTIGGLADHLGRLRQGTDASGLFADLGFAYLGPVDGHDVGAVEDALHAARKLNRPALVHCVTVKGRGYEPAEGHELDQLHAVRPSYHLPAGPSVRTWTDVFADQIVALGEERPDVVALTAAMLDPTGLTAFQKRFPDRVFDVGIAEQHAVVSAAGLALGGMHPVVCLYATFLNRAFDQLLMDVALHRCGVTFVLDRAGVTGDDGASHNGIWDLSLLQVVPGLAIAAPRDSRTLKAQLREAVAIADRPTVVRFPKGAVGPDVPAVTSDGGIDVLYRGKRPDVLVVSVGAMARTCLDVANRLAAHDIGATVVDPRWVKPVNPMLAVLAGEHRLVITVEDNGRVGGVGAAISQVLQDEAVATPVRVFGLPARFPDHGKRTEIFEECQLTSQDIARAVVEAVSRLDSVHSVLMPRAAVETMRGYR